MQEPSPARAARRGKEGSAARQEPGLSLGLRLSPLLSPTLLEARGVPPGWGQGGAGSPLPPASIAVAAFRMFWGFFLSFVSKFEGFFLLPAV